MRYGGSSQILADIILEYAHLPRKCIEIVKSTLVHSFALCSRLGFGCSATLRNILSASRSILLSILAPLLRR